MSRQLSKRNSQRQNRKKWHRKPRGKTYARYTGITAKIAEHERKRVFIEARLAKIQTAADRDRRTPSVRVQTRDGTLHE